MSETMKERQKRIQDDQRDGCGKAKKRRPRAIHDQARTVYIVMISGIRNETLSSTRKPGRRKPPKTAERGKEMQEVSKEACLVQLKRRQKTQRVEVGRASNKGNGQAKQGKGLGFLNRASWSDPTLCFGNRKS